MTLARAALQLALTDEIAPTLRPNIVSSVAVRHPGLAFDFTLAHLSQILPFVEPDSRALFVPGLLEHAWDTSLIPRLRAYAAGQLPASQRRAAVQAEASIAFAAQVRMLRLPEVSAWLEKNPL